MGEGSFVNTEVVDCQVLGVDWWRGCEEEVQESAILERSSALAKRLRLSLRSILRLKNRGFDQDYL